MSKPLIQIGHEVREMTDEESAEYELRRLTVIQEQEQAEVQAAAKAAAQEKLTALGLTVEDLQALGL